MAWMGGMVLLAMTASLPVSARPSEGTGGRLDIISVILMLDARFTSPAMLITWLLGLVLIMTGGWFPPSGWLILKLVAVFLLSGFHGMLTGYLRKILKGNGDTPPPTFRYAGVPFAVTATLVVLMATTKPF